MHVQHQIHKQTDNEKSLHIMRRNLKPFYKGATDERQANVETILSKESRDLLDQNPSRTQRIFYIATGTFR